MVPPKFDATFVEQLDLLMRWRRDVRHFRRDTLPEGDALRLIEAAALAPSVGNAQPWRFVRVRSAALRETLAQHVDASSAMAADEMADPVRQEKYRALKLHGLREAPEVMAVFNDDHPPAGHSLGRATMPETLRYSTVMAIYNLWLSARAVGLGVGWVSIVDPVAVAKILEVADGWALIALLCIGYPVEPADVPELEQREWQARLPVGSYIIDRR